jgi:hypothetical protein
LNNFVTSLAIYNGELVAGGYFTAAGGVAATGVARWNGSDWGLVALGVSEVSALAVYGGELFVSGPFYRVGEVGAINIVRWNGAEWTSVGSGIGGAASTMIVYRGELVAGRWMLEGNAPMRWDGASWRSTGPGTNGFFECLEVFDGGVIAGGAFTSVGGVRANLVARWDPHGWTALPGFDGDWGDASVDALNTHEGELVAAVHLPPARPDRAEHFVARREAIAGEWRSLGAGMDGPVLALTTYSGDLIAGGRFTTAGGGDASNIARWDGTGWRALGGGVNGAVRALAVHNGDLIAAGEFTSAGGQSAGYIARWSDLSGAWSPMGSGLNYWARSLLDFEGDLIVGGVFSEAGGASALHVARWTDAGGGAWRALGAGFVDPVEALASYQGSLVAGGRDVMRWDGVDGVWRRLGAFNFQVKAVVPYLDELVVGGWFSTVDGMVSVSWARWGSPPLCCGPADFDGDGSPGTDRDIEAFFACLAGACCGTCFSGGADFNGDGDVATDADIESFFRVLAGGPC